MHATSSLPATTRLAPRTAHSRHRYEARPHRHLVLRWVATAGLIAFVAAFGRDFLLSAWGREIIGWDRPWTNPGFLLRKIGHLVTYAGVWMIAWSLVARIQHRPLTRWSARRARDAYLVTLGVAMLDEWHQTFVPGRFGHLSDVLIDALGAALAVLLVHTLLRRIGSKSELRPSR